MKMNGRVRQRPEYPEGCGYNAAMTHCERGMAFQLRTSVQRPDQISRAFYEVNPFKS